jgi:hypothetical protein
MEALLQACGAAAESSWQFIGGGVAILADGGGQAGTALVNVSTQLTTGLIEGIQNIFLLVG